MRIPSCLALALLLCGCQAPPPRSGLVAPDGEGRVSVESVPPAPGSDELLPTVRLRLQHSSVPGSLVLMDGARSLCDTDIRWTDAAHLYLRVPEERLPGLHVRDGDTWGAVSIRLDVHQDQVLFRRESPDGSLSLLVIAQCESGHWNLYLRHRGDPDYKAAMAEGWGDPELFGGFMEEQPALALEWMGPRQACIEVALNAYGMTLKPEVAGVKVDWIFRRDFRRATLREGTLGALKPRPGSTPDLHKYLQK